MARTWLAVNVGDQRAAKWAKGMVLEAKSAKKVLGKEDIIGEEVWRVKVIHQTGGYLETASNPSPSVQVYWIIAETGEIIGHSPDDPYATEPPPFSPNDIEGLRHDWSELLDSGLNSSSTSASNRMTSAHGFNSNPLFNLIRWSNAEEYRHGISKHWLNRLAAQVDQIDAERKRAVAERYVLASVASNR